MKTFTKTTSVWMAAAGLAMGLAVASMNTQSARAICAPAAMPSAWGDDKVDLTPKYKKGDKFTFKQRTVRTDTMVLGNMPAPVKEEAKPEAKPADAKDAPKGDAPKADAPKTDKPKTDAPTPPKSEPGKDAKPAEGATGKGAIQQTANGMSSTQVVDQTAVFELRAVDVSEAESVFELELKSIVATADLPQGKFEWDSDKPPAVADANNPILQSYRPIVGAIAKIKVGPDGNITGVEPDARLNLNAKGSMAPMVQQLVGVDGIRLRWGTVIWPKDGREAAKTGQAWTNTDEMLFAAVGKFTYTTSNTLKSVKDGVAEIAITGEAKLGPMPDGKAPSGKMKDQHLAGSCLWDVAKGVAKSQTWNQKTVLDINAGGFEVVRTSEFTVTTTRE